MKLANTVALAAVAASSLAMVGASPVQAAASHTYSTGFQIQNLSSTTANVTMSFYAQGSSSSTPSATFSTTVPGSQSVNYSTLPDAVSAGFTGGAVISSDQKVAATVNIVVDGDVYFGDAYTGVSAGSTSVTLPLLFRESYGFNTFFNVQNTDTAAAAVTVTYSNGTTETSTVQPGATARFDQSTNSALALSGSAGFTGSAVVTADKNVAVTVAQVDTSTLANYNGFGDTSNLSPVFPLINSNNSGYVTGIPITNVGNASTDVTVTYTPGSQATYPKNPASSCTETQTIGAGETKYFALYSQGPSTAQTVTSTCTKGGYFVGSGKVTTNTASQPLVALVSQLNSAGKKSGIYSAFNATTATSTVLFPIINDRFYGYNTGFTIVNVGTGTVNVVCSYAGSSYQDTATLAPDGVLGTLQTNKLADKTNTSGTCVATATDGSTPKIVGVINQLSVSASLDALFVSGGINN